MILHVLRAEAEDYEKLTDICLQTNRHWGYPEYLIDLWKDELTITPRYIRKHNLLKVQNEHDQILGFGSIENVNGNGTFEIHHLWVLPEFSGKNIEKILLAQLESWFGEKKVINVVSDPNALEIFRNFGYQKVGEVESRPDGRRLPLLKKIIMN